MGGRGASSGTGGGSALSRNQTATNSIQEVVSDKELTRYITRDARKYVPKEERQQIAQNVKQRVDSLRPPAVGTERTYDVNGYKVTAERGNNGYSFTTVKANNTLLGGSLYSSTWDEAKSTMVKQIARDIVTNTAYKRQRNAT